MSRNWKWLRIALTALLAAGLLWGSLAWAKKPPKPDPDPDPEPTPTVAYTLEMLGTLPGADSSFAVGINDFGDAVGYSGRSAFVSINVEGVRVMYDLNTLLDVDEQLEWDLRNANDINNSGQIVGGADRYEIDDSGEVPQRGALIGGFAYRLTLDLNSLETPLFVEDLGFIGRAEGINDEGDVVGTSADIACIYTDADGMFPLPLFGEAVYSSGFAINDSMEAAGSAYLSGMGMYRAWRFSSLNGMQDLGVIKKGRGGISWSSADSINNDGDVVGQSTAGAQRGRTVYHAFLYTDTAGMIDLGTLGGKESHATGINDLGDVTGWSDAADQVRHLFVYSNSQGMARVEVEGGMPGALYHNVQARINMSGQISGTVGDVFSGEVPQAFLLTPVPLGE